MSRATILIPVNNRRELTLGCLRTLQANGDLATCDVIVIDDGSTDDTDTLVAAEFPAIELLRGDGTLFWTGAIALATREAQSRHLNGPLIWLNDDCRPRKGAIPSLVAYVTSNPRALAGPTCVDATTGTTVPSGFIRRRVCSPREGETITADGLSGFCVAVGHEAWTTLGAPDSTNFPHYAGDTAYTLRATRNGFTVAILSAAVVDLTHHSPTGISDRLRADLGWSTDFRRVFSQTNSPYRLHTLFALLRLKYGAVLGTGLAVGRTAAWVTRFASAKLRTRG